MIRTIAMAVACIIAVCAFGYFLAIQMRYQFVGVYAEYIEDGKYYVWKKPDHVEVAESTYHHMLSHQRKVALSLMVTAAAWVMLIYLAHDHKANRPAQHQTHRMDP